MWLGRLELNPVSKPPRGGRKEDQNHSVQVSESGEQCLPGAVAKMNTLMPAGRDARLGFLLCCPVAPASRRNDLEVSLSHPVLEFLIPRHSSEWKD